MTRLKTTFTAAVDIKCCPHTLNIMGDKFDLARLRAFISTWVTILYSNPAAMLLWKKLIQDTPTSGGTARR